MLFKKKTCKQNKTETQKSPNMFKSVEKFPAKNWQLFQQDKYFEEHMS